MLKLFRMFLIVVLFAALPAMAQEGEETPLNITEFTLENGLQVILVEDHSAPTVAVDVWYRVGGANDPEGRSGFAHLFEHLMFEGSAHVPSGEFDVLLGGIGGNNNAYTATEVTGYWEVLPSNYLPLGLWLEADRMASLRVNPVSMEVQRSVVIEEYNFRVSNSPYGAGINDLYTLPHDYAPYQRWTIGSPEDLNAASFEDVKDFHATYYVPNNATLVVAGDLDPEATSTLVEELFGQIPRQADPPALPAYEPTQREAAEEITIEDGLINTPLYGVAYVLPPRNHPDFPALELVSQILGSGASSRMAQAFLDTGLAADMGSFTDGNRGPSLLISYVFPNEGVDLEQTAEVYNAEIDKILNEGVDPLELEKTINGIRSGRIVGLETAMGLAESVQTANFYFGSTDAIFGEIERYEEVTVEDIQRVVQEYMAPEDQVVINVVPGEETLAPGVAAPATTEGDPEAFVSTVILAQDTPPDPLPLSEFNLPNITETTLANGLQVIVVEKPEIPIISIDLVLRGGESAVASEQAGLAELTADTLTRGTETRSAQEIAQTIEQVGGVIGSGASQDALTVGVFATKEDIPLAFELLGDVALNPSFPQNEFEIARENLLNDQLYYQSDPEELSIRTFTDLLYGDHPYGNISTSESLEALTREDVTGYYQAQAHPANSFLIVAGDISLDEAVEMAESTFGGWQGEGESPSVTYAAPPQREGIEIYLLDRPGSTQANVVVGQTGLMGDSPDRFSTVVLNHVLGGNGLLSRLALNLREEKGYTYGVGSSFSFPTDLGYFRVRSAVGNDVVEPALREILGEIERIQTEEVSEDELAQSEGNLIGSYAADLETYQSFVDAIINLKMRGQSLDALGTYGQDIEAVDSAAVLAAAQQYINAENLLIVVVGDASVIQDDLENIAPVTVIAEE
jgi:zinc protease